MPLQKNQLHQGDCVKLLAELEEGSVDLVFADPPFNIGYVYDVYDDQRPEDDYLSWCGQWIEGVYRALKPNGTFWLAIGDEYAAELKIESQKAGFHCRSWVIWYYTFGVNCVNGFSRSHTHLFHFVKDKKSFTFNRFNPQIRVKSARQLVYADNRANPNGRLPDNTWITRPQDAPLSFSPNHDTWFFSRVAGTFKEREGFHGCQMPEQLLARVIRSSSHPQDLVLDPFGGSGTTLCVAKKLARNYIGFELSEEYAERIQERLARTHAGDPLDGPEDPIESAPSTSKGKKRAKPFDQKTEQVVIDAFQSVSQGHSPEFVLCDPELDAEFIDHCLDKGIGGTAAVWNRYLLHLRSLGKLPPAKHPLELTTPEQMERFGFASEVAWRLLTIDYQKSLDEILCTPEFAKEFDRLALEFAPSDAPISSFELRCAAVTIRQLAHEARQVAAESCEDWVTGEKPLQSVSTRDSLTALDQPGIAILMADQSAIFADYTANMQRRVEQWLSHCRWAKLEANSVAYVAVEDKLENGLALKAALVAREHPLLNCQLWSHDTELPGLSIPASPPAPNPQQQFAW